MPPSQLWSWRLAVAVILTGLSSISAFNVEYCSTINTATSSSNTSIYQSNGACEQLCIANYAFGIVQGHQCWCSNDAPDSSTNVDGSECDTTCPGYPNDLCGGDNLYGYIALTLSPEGTEGASSATSSGSTQSSSTAATTSTPSSASTTTTSSDSSSTTWTPTPVISLETVTGQIRTVTVTPTVPPASSITTGITTGMTSKKSSGLSTGGAVGLTVGLVALVALVCSIIYFCFRKRQKEKAAADPVGNESHRGSSAGLGGPIPSRTMSENSRYFLGTDGRQVVETWEPENRDQPGSRRSRLMPVDPRLDPFAPVYQRGENKSRESFNTIRDDHDYSRRFHAQGPILRATNPDSTGD